MKAPLEVARALAARYGHKLAPVVYTQGVAISGRLRLHRLDGKSEDPAPAITVMLEPYLSGGKAMFTEKAGGAELAGVVWADELAEVTADTRYARLLIAAADLFKSRRQGQPPAPCDLDFRAEDIFFAGAVLGRAYSLTGAPKYAGMLANFLSSAPAQREDGLFWHSTAAPWCWGRANGFAALGLAEALSYLPGQHPGRDALVVRHRRHLDALMRHQAQSGMFRQVIDVESSYEELSATCMIGYAIVRGLRRGWLDGSFLPAVERSWRAASGRVGEDGSVAGVCVGTGVQANSQAYLDRPAVSGFDDRGGAMALWFATELASLTRQERRCT